MSRPRVGLMLPMGSGDLERISATAVQAEELGFDGVFAYDHFFAPGTSPANPSPRFSRRSRRSPYARNASSSGRWW